MINLGSLSAASFKLGSTSVQQIYLGSQLVWPQVTPSALLLHMDGSNGSTTFTDSSTYNRTVTAAGDAQISTASSQFGGASAYFDGNGDYITIPHAPSLNPGTGDFTIEFWSSTGNGGTNTQRIFRKGGFASTSGGYGIELYCDASGSALKVLIGNSSGYTVWDCTVGLGVTWRHFALVRTSGTLLAFYNGVNVLTASGMPSSPFTIPTTAAITTDDDLVIGGSLSLGRYYQGYIDEFRWTTGAALYTSNFTPPTSPFPNA